MRKKLLLLAAIAGTACADSTGLYLGGGLGYGMQSLTSAGTTGTQSSTVFRAFVGYQMFSFLGAEAGYTYFTQGSNWNNLGNPSSTVYDVAITPGLSIPLTPLTVYGRLGLDAVSANLNTGWSGQLVNNMSSQLELGGGIKFSIPATNVFIRAEYINFGGVTNNSNSNVNVTPSVVMLDAAYVF